MESPHVNLEYLIAALKLAKEKEELDWKDICAESGVTRAVVSRMINRRAVPRVDSLARLAWWLGSTLDEFITYPKDKWR